MTSLRGMQLALLPEVQPYWLENPGRPHPTPVRSGGDEARPRPAQMALELPETSPKPVLPLRVVSVATAPRDRPLGD